MEISYKLYPYPVLAGFNDDFVDSSFKVEVTQQETRDIITFEFEMLLENDHLNHLIENNQVEFAIHIECSSTLYRNLIKTKSPSYVLELPSSILNGKVNICPFIIAKSDIEKYTNPNFNFYYDGITFFIEKNNILAIADQIDVFIDKDYDDIKNVSSIFVITKNFESDAKEIEIIYEDIIYIKLPPEQYSSFKILSLSIEHKQLINSLFVIPILVKIFEELKNSPDLKEERSETKWYRSIKNALNKKGIDLESESFENQDSIRIAQLLLDQPILSTIDRFSNMGFDGGYEDEN